MVWYFTADVRIVADGDDGTHARWPVVLCAFAFVDLWLYDATRGVVIRVP